MRRKRWRMALLAAATLALMAAIFAFSAQPGPASDELTQAAAMPLAELASSLQEGADEETVLYLYNIIGTLVRKLAHLGEYTLLGLLLSLLAREMGLRQKWLPLAAGAAYAVTDEVHQLFVPGRSGLVTDVLLDTLGVLLGLWAARIIEKIRRKTHVHDQ